MAQNPLAQEGSWFHESWKRKASRAMGGEKRRGYSWVSSCSQATSTPEKAPNLQDLKQTTCLAYPARLRGANPDVTQSLLRMCAATHSTFH